jgi:hypothetical protein
MGLSIGTAAKATMRSGECGSKAAAKYPRPDTRKPKAPTPQRCSQRSDSQEEPP